MRILITGSSGFIGSHIVSIASSLGMEVFALCRSNKVENRKRVKTFHWTFGQPLPEKSIVDIDCVIHLSHDFNGIEGSQKTITSTLTIAKQLSSLEVQKQIFFSSYSAGEHSTSLYGKTKLSIENGLKKISGVTIVRPGLVIGNGGIYGRIKKWSQLLPVIPLPEGGNGKIPIIDINELCRRIIEIITNPSTKNEINIFEKDFKSLRQLVLEAALECGKIPKILAVPNGFLLAALKTAQKLKLPLPVNADNLAGFIANQKLENR